LKLGLNDHHHDHAHQGSHDEGHDHHQMRHDSGADSDGGISFGARPFFAWLRRRWRLVVLAAYALSGVYFVAPDQQAVVVRFGKVVAKGLTPGVHYSLPWPIESVYKLKVLETKRLTIGIEMPDQALGRVAAENPTEYLTGDQNLISVRMAVQYAVKDPAAFLFRSQDVTQLIAKSVESAFAETIAAENVDGLLTTGKVAAQNATLIAAREILDAYASGVFIGSINIESVTPPAEVEKLVTDAESYRQQRINEAEGDAARFSKLLAESRKAKDVTERRLYLETMEEVLPRVKKVVIDSSGPKSLMDLGIIRPNP
jgi:membrane protease subunit HflK